MYYTQYSLLIAGMLLLAGAVYVMFGCAFDWMKGYVSDKTFLYLLLGGMMITMVGFTLEADSDVLRYQSVPMKRRARSRRRSAISAAVGCAALIILTFFAK